MSTTVETKVVEMQFKNSNFEKNATATMSVLDKLKTKFNFDSAAKSAEQLNSSISKVNLNPLSSAATAVGNSFKTMEVITITAIANLTNSAINSGKRIVSALTIDPVMAGMSEYETKLNSIQTILANTSHEGTNLTQVTNALNELNEYSDKTIYNFAEMTRNIGTFTAAGVSLDTSVSAIKGIANLAAISGSTSQQASTAMYQLSQALAAGRVSLMDWNSVVNAGMGGKVFQDALMETAEVMGIAVDRSLSFRDSISAQSGDSWLTSDVLLSTLENFTGDLSAAELAAKGYSEAQVESILKMGETATDAATKVKTFTQLFSTLTETAQSGWALTWEYILGDFEQAKELFTGLNDIIGGMISTAADARNNLIRDVFGSNWDKLEHEIMQTGVSLEDFKSNVTQTAVQYGLDMDNMIAEAGSFEASLKEGWLTSDIISDTISNMIGETVLLSAETENLGDTTKLAYEVIAGAWGNGEERVRRLTEAGHDFSAVQHNVNQILWDQIEVLDDMSEAELEAIGYTEEQVEALKALQKELNNTDSDLNNYANNLDAVSGRDLFVESLLAIASTMSTISKTMDDAIDAVFGDTFNTLLKNALVNINNATKAFDNFMKGDGGQILYNSLVAIFTIVDLLGHLISTAFNAVWTTATSILSLFNINLTGTSDGVSNAITGFAEWIKQGQIFETVFSGISFVITEAVKIIKSWIEYLSQSEIAVAIFTRIKEAVSGAFTVIKDFFVSVQDGSFSFEENFAFLDNISFQGVVDTFNMFKDNIVKAFSDVGEFISGFASDYDVSLASVETSTEGFAEMIYEFGEAIVTFVRDNLGTIVAAGAVVGILKLTGDILRVAENISEAVQSFTDVFKSFDKFLDAQAFQARAEGIKSIAMSIGILVGALWVISTIDPDRLWESFGVLMALIGAMAAMVVGSTFLKNTKDVVISAGSMIAFAVTMLILANALKMLQGMSFGEMLTAVIGMSILLIAFTRLARVTTRGAKDANAALKKAFSLVILAGAIWLLVKALESVGKADTELLLKAIINLIPIVISIGLLMLSLRAGGKNAASAAIAVLLMSGVILLFYETLKAVTRMDPSVLLMGMLGLIPITIAITMLLLSLRSAGKDAIKAAISLIPVSIAVAILANVVKMLGEIPLGDLVKGTLVVGAFLLFMYLFMSGVNKLDKDLPKLAGTLIGLSVAIGILSLVIWMLSFLDPVAMIPGVIAVSVLMISMGITMELANGMAKVDFKKIIAMGVLVTLLVGIMAILTLIEPKKLLVSMTAMVAVILSLSIMMKMLNEVKVNFASILIVILTLGAMTAVLMTLDMMQNPDSLIQKAVAMGVLLLAVGTSLKVLDQANIKIDLNLVTALATMVLVMIAVVEVLRVLSTVQTEGLLERTLALEVLFLSIVGSLVVLDYVNSISAMVIIALGVLSLIMLLISEVLINLNNVNSDGLMEKVLALEIIFITLVAATAVLGIAGPALAGGVLFGLGAMGLVIVAMLALLTILGGVVTAIPDALTFLEKGMPVLLLIAEAIGGFIGVLIATLAEHMLTIVPMIGEAMSDFMVKLLPFMLISQMVPDNILEKITLLTGALGAITNAQIMAGLGQFMSFGMDWEKIGTDLKLFAQAMVDFDNALANGDLDIDRILKGGEAASALASIYQYLPKEGGLMDGIFGTTDMEAFNESIISFVEGMVKIEEDFGDETFNKKLFQDIATAGKWFADLANAIPKKGGLLQDIVGEADLGDFGDSVGAFALAMYRIQTGYDGKPGMDGVTFNVQLFKDIASAGEPFAALAETIPQTGGLLQKLVGETDIGLFGTRVLVFADRMKAVQEYFDNTNTVLDPDLFTSIADAGKPFVALQDTLPQDGGFLQTIIGSSDIQDFGLKVETFAGCIKTILSDFRYVKWDEDLFDDIAGVGAKFVALQNVIPSSGGWTWIWEEGDTTLDEFGKQISAFATHLNNFSINLTDFDSEKSDKAIAQLETLTGVANIITSTSVNDLTNFITALETLAVKSVSTFSTTLSDNITTATDTVQELMDAITDKVKTNVVLSSVKIGGDIDLIFATVAKDNENVLLAGETIVDSFYIAFDDLPDKNESLSASLTGILENIATFEEDFATAGDKLITELEDAIKTNVTVSNAITNNINKGLTALEPYRASFYLSGKNLVQGLANGITQNSAFVLNAVKSVGNSAVNTLNRTLMEKSPSRATWESGMYFDLGLAGGIDEYSGDVISAVNHMGEDSLSELQTILSTIDTAMDNDSNYQPVIAPVLDLSNIQNGGNLIQGMLGTKSLSINSLAQRTEGLIATVPGGSFNQTQPSSVVNNNKASNMNNTFNITAEDPEAVANKVSEILQEQIDRDTNIWK